MAFGVYHLESDTSFASLLYPKEEKYLRKNKLHFFTANEMQDKLVERKHISHTLQCINASPWLMLSECNYNLSSAVTAELILDLSFPDVKVPNFYTSVDHQMSALFPSHLSECLNWLQVLL